MKELAEADEPANQSPTMAASKGSERPVRLTFVFISRMGFQLPARYGADSQPTPVYGQQNSRGGASSHYGGGQFQKGEMFFSGKGGG
jgi:hypothetical protein